MTRRNLYRALQALAAAFLFGAITPVSKLLLRDIETAWGKVDHGGLGIGAGYFYLSVAFLNPLKSGDTE